MRAYFFSEDHLMFRQSFREFLTREIAPEIDSWEETGSIPKAVFTRFGELGYLGMGMDPAAGGSGLDFFFTVVLLEELQRLNSGGFSAAIGAHAFLALPHLAAEGSDFLRENYLRPGIAGTLVGALAITEPGGGSDVAAMRCAMARIGCCMAGNIRALCTLCSALRWNG